MSTPVTRSWKQILRQKQRAPRNHRRRHRLLVGEQLEDRALLTAIELVSVADPNLPPSDSSNAPSSAQRVSDDGRFVVFDSLASNLVDDDHNGRRDVFLRDRALGTTTLVSMIASGTSANGDSYGPVISADGSVVVYVSRATDLTGTGIDTDAIDDVYMYDVATGTNTLVSVSSTGTGSANNTVAFPVISADGSRIAFQSRASNLVGGDTNGRDDVFLFDVASGSNTLVSVNDPGTGSGNHDSRYPVISADGSKVAFESAASNLISNDTNGIGTDIFLYDANSGNNTLVSINATGTGSGNGDSHDPVISADGSKVAFESSASNLVNIVTGKYQHIFLYDMATASNTLVSINSIGTGSANGWSYNAVISADGSKVAFESSASNLVSNDTNGTYQDVFLYDVATASNALVSINSTGTGSGNNYSYDPMVSADGSRVAFRSQAANLVSNDTNATFNDVFLYEVATASNVLVSVNAIGTGSGNLHSLTPVISADGSTVTFLSDADDLVADDGNAYRDVFAWENGTIELISVADPNLGSVTPDGWSYTKPTRSMSDDGRYVVFDSNATNLVAGDDNRRTDVFLRDRLLGITTLISKNLSGNGSANDQSYAPEISADGSKVTFQSRASDLVSNDTNGTRSDVFLYDVATASNTLVSVDSSGTGSGNFDSIGPVISADGSKIAFYGQASNLVSNDTNGTQYDVFLYDVAMATNTLVSVNIIGTESGKGNSYTPVISADGSKVAFYSAASNLNSKDTNGSLSDVFLYDVATATNALVSVDSTGSGSANNSSLYPVISADGSKVAYLSIASNITASDTDGNQDIFLFDVASGTNTLVSVNSAGTGSGNNSSIQSSYYPVVSDDGSKVVFQSRATNISSNDIDSFDDIFLFDVATETNRLVSVDSTGTASGNGRSYGPVISPDGSKVAFTSQATNLTAGDADAYDDVFLYDVATETNTLISINVAGTASGNSWAYDPSFSGDGSTIAFSSSASDLILDDYNNTGDVFVYALNGGPSVDNAAFDVAENSTSVGTVTASDPDTGDALTFAITGGADAGLFSVEPTTGELTFDAPPDYESPADADLDNTYELVVTVTDSQGASDSATIMVNVLNEAYVTGFVFADVDNDGVFDAEDAPLASIEITLVEAGVDQLFGTLDDETFSTTTDIDGFYAFEDVAAGIVRIAESGAPANLIDGLDTPNGASDLDAVDDQFTIDMPRTDVNGMNFAELPDSGGLSSGDTATIGFWHNKHGQSLIDDLDEDGALSAWLLDNFDNIFDQADFDEYGGSLAEFYRMEFFKQKLKGTPKVDAQFMAVAFAAFATSSNLSNGAATAYGFNVTDTGIGSKVFNVGSSGAAFGVVDGTDMTIMALLQATNRLTGSGADLVYDGAQDLDNDGVVDDIFGSLGSLDDFERWLREAANDVYTAINEGGDI